MKDWAAHYRNLLIAKFVSNAGDMLSMSAENLEKIKQQSLRLSVAEIDSAIRRLSRTINDARWSTNPRVLLELAIVAISSGEGNSETAAAPVAPAKKLPEEPAPAVSHSAAPSVSSPTRTSDASEEENIKLWHEIFEEGEDAAGSFNLIRSGTTLEHVGKETFTVATVSSFTKRFTEQKRQELEEMMSRRLGRPMRLICELRADEAAAEEKKAEKDEQTARIAEKAKDILGIDIEIE